MRTRRLAALPRAGPHSRDVSFTVASIVGFAGWIAVGLPPGLPLSFVGPALMTRHTRQGIAAWTWPPPSFRFVKPFTAEVLESDTGKLAFLYVFEFGIGMVIVGFAILFLPFGYFLSSGNPIVFGAALMLIAAAAARIPLARTASLPGSSASRNCSIRTDTRCGSTASIKCSIRRHSSP